MCLAHSTWAASDQRGHRNLSSSCRNSTAQEDAAAGGLAQVSPGVRPPQRRPAGMPGPPPRTPFLTPHRPGGEILKPTSPASSPSTGSETWHFHPGLLSGSRFFLRAGRGAVDSGSCRAPAVCNFTFSLFLSERCMTNPGSRAPAAVEPPWCSGSSKLFSFLLCAHQGRGLS